VTRSKKVLLANYLLISLVLILIFPLLGASVTDLNSTNDFDFCEIKNNLNVIDVENIYVSHKDNGRDSSLLKSWLDNNYVDKFYTHLPTTINTYTMGRKFLSFSGFFAFKIVKPSKRSSFPV
jgi:hypothetical protein